MGFGKPVVPDVSVAVNFVQVHRLTNKRKKGNGGMDVRRQINGSFLCSAKVFVKAYGLVFVVRSSSTEGICETLIFRRFSSTSPTTGTGDSGTNMVSALTVSKSLDRASAP
jgi:hypothetical protein